jgi:23S rRNA (guanosine2251-2'-O)-methyltransferase
MTTDYLYGLHAVRTLLLNQPEAVLELRTCSERHDQRLQEIITLADRHGVKHQIFSRDKLNELAGGARHQGVVARCRLPGRKDEDSLAELVKSRGSSVFLLVLDNVQDPHNLGACLRSADAAGVHAVIIPKSHSASITPAVVKVASGAAFSVPVFEVTNLARTLKLLKDLGVWLVGTDGEANDSVYQMSFTSSTALVMGGEGGGLRRLTKEHCDYLVKIPMAGVVESLNVSVAAGICLYEVVRQRSSG